MHEELELDKNFFEVLTSHLFLTDLVFSSRFSYLSASSSELHGCLLKICQKSGWRNVVYSSVGNTTEKVTQ